MNLVTKRQCLLVPVLLTMGYCLAIFHMTSFPLGVFRPERAASQEQVPPSISPEVVARELPKKMNISSFLDWLRAHKVDYQTMTPAQIGEFQQAQVELFCQAYLKSNENKNILKQMPKRQMLVSDKTQTAFCYVPKAGCTTLKTLLFLTLGAIPNDVLQNKSLHPSELLMEEAIDHNSFKTKNKSEHEYVIRNYYKFIMYRNPVERLVSAYISKIRDIPLIGLEDSQPERNWIRSEIYEFTHPHLYHTWVKAGASTPITIDFIDFIKYYIKTGGIKYDEHFTPIFNLCSPCYVRYSYYGNFKTFGREVDVFSNRIGGNLSLLLDAEHQNEPTSNIAPNLYKLLTREQKIKIINILKADLYFYYSIFPSEIDSHKSIMGVEYELPKILSADVFMSM